MPRPRPLPTPSSSTDLAAVDKVDMEGTFSLPPPARPTPPVSPKASSPRHKRTLSGTTKPKEDEPYDLPPPPTRARKIIQMKPKSNSSSESAPPPKPQGTKRKQPSATS